MSRALARPAGKRKVLLLSFVGPALLVILAAFWLLLLVLGFALLYWPALGTSLEASKGGTSTDFLAALYYSGFSFTTLGLGDIEPQTALLRMLTVTEAALGFSFFTLTITYFLSVYS